MDATYLSCAETAKLVRAALKKAFPTVKFSVRSHTYAGGASIDVDWTDGPRGVAVKAVCDVFEGGDFDGMIDLKISNQHWLLPDGSAVMAKSYGTEGSGGFIPRVANPQPHPDARLVRFSADFIFEHRKISNEAARVSEAEAMIRARCVLESGDRFGGHFVVDVARHIVFDVDHLTENSTEPAFRRVVMHETIDA